MCVARLAVRVRKDMLRKPFGLDLRINLAANCNDYLMDNTSTSAFMPKEIFLSTIFQFTPPFFRWQAPDG
jgi:hypothetical protein